MNWAQSMQVHTSKMADLTSSIERTIKAINSVKQTRHKIIVLDEVPKSLVAQAVRTTSVGCCSAMNLNGTPCKFKAKIGKFCQKHSR